MTQLLQNAVYGGALILVAAVLRRGLKGRFAPEARLVLWAVCLFRLLTPTAPESMLSLWGLGRWFGQGTQSVPVPDLAALPSNGTAAFATDAPVAPAPAQAEAGVPWGAVLAAVWAIVGAVLAVRYAASYVRTRRAVGYAVPVGRDDPRYAALPQCARLREGPVDGAPLTFGVVRPTVVLTPGLSGTELECVLAHEGVHARRRDNLWHYAMAAALVVHWWNPAVWLMSRLLRRDIELSCDRAAVKKLGADRWADYAEALVSLSTKTEGPAFCQTFGRKAAEERIIAVMKYKKTTIVGAALTLALVLAVTVAFASNPAEPVPDEESTTSSAPAPMLYMSSFSPEGELLKISLSLDCLEESLAEHVADGSMTEQDAAACLDAARELSQDGVMLEWTFMGHSGLFTHMDSHREGFDIYYLDVDGHEAPVDPATVVSAFILPDSLDQSLSRYLDDIEPSLVETGWADPDDYDRPMTLEEYGVLLDQLVAGGKMSQADADWLLDGAATGLEGQIGAWGCPYLWATGDGSYAIKGGNICTLADCGNTERHTHDGVWYTGWTNKSIYYPAVQWDNQKAPAGEQGLAHDPQGPEDSGGIYSYPPVPTESEIPEFVPDYDPNVQDSIGADDEPIACPPEVIDQNVQILPDGVDWVCGLPLAPTDGGSNSEEN